MTNATTIASRSALRNEILNKEDKRVTVPFNFDLITPIVVPRYAELWQELLATREPGVVYVEYTPETHDEFIAFLRGWIQANGKNRCGTETNSHVTELIGWMRDGFSPPSTNFSVNKKGNVDNGGHSGKAILRAFFPESAYYGLHGTPVIIEEVHVPLDELEADESGYYFAGPDGLAYSSVVPAMPNDTVVDDGIEVAKYPPVGEFDDNGAYIPGSDTPEIRSHYIDKADKKCKQHIAIKIDVFGEETTLHRENTTLAPTAETYLELAGNIKTHYAETIPTWLKGKMGQLLTMLRKRTMHGSTGGFGTVGRGGRMNGEDAPTWYLAYMPSILDSIALLSDTTGNQRPRPLFTPFKGDANNPSFKGGASILQILTAMSVSDEKGRKRIADWVCGDGKDYEKNEGLAKLVDVVRPPKAATTGTLPTDAVVELLVLVGLGKTDPIEVFEQDWQRPTGKDGAMESAAAWSIEECRASGWDRCDIDTLPDGNDVLSASLVEYAKSLSGEGSRAVKSANRKAPKGKPKAKK